MKTLMVIAMLCGMFAVEVFAEAPTLTIDRFVPTQIGEDWVRRKDAGAKGDHSWVHFDNKQHPGEVLGFLATKVPPQIDVRSASVGQASIEMFSNNGTAQFLKLTGVPITETVRHRIISIRVSTTDFNRELESIEYTYVYEPEDGSPTTIAHGYCVVAAETVFFVQHTSPQVISSDLAFQMVAGMVAKHLQLDGKPHGYSKGKVLKSND